MLKVIKYASLLRRARFIYDIQISRQYATKKLQLSDKVTVKEIARKTGVPAPSIIELLKDYGYSTQHGKNTVLDFDIAEAIADEYNFSAELKTYMFVKRPPVVTIMGHVDHGKTTLLDNLRSTSVADQEAGGITQSIGAFSVQVPGAEQERVTFVDTPGHAAFNSMRYRGAHLTDIAVLVVAADDGIMPQTKECIKHIQQAKVPLIVAINKIDKPNINVKKLRSDLLTNAVHLEEFGGDVKSIEISALKGTNIDTFLHLLNEVSSEKQTSAKADVPAEAVVLEVQNNKYTGAVASILMKHGEIKVGSVILAGSAFAKVRKLFDHNGHVMTTARPSDPCQVIGWRGLPQPGDVVLQVNTEAEARSLIKEQEQELKDCDKNNKVKVKAPPPAKENKKIKGKLAVKDRRTPLRVTMRQDAASGVKQQAEDNNELALIIKADASGSLEAIVSVLSSFHSSHVKLNVIEASVGQVNESDLNMAVTCHGHVYSFNVETDRKISAKAEKLGISINSHDIIYKLMDDVKVLIEDRLPVLVSETVLGKADVLSVFRLTGSKKGVAAGCRVADGSLDNTSSQHVWKVVRNNEQIHQGPAKSLKRGSSDIGSAKTLSECGVILQYFDDFQTGDRLLCVRIDKTKQTVNWKL